jgi:hypothetical protein
MNQTMNQSHRHRKRGNSWELLLLSDWGDLASADFPRILNKNRDLAETIRLAASARLIGRGREVLDPIQAVKMLGAGRVRHLVLLHRMRALLPADGDGAAECVSYAGAAYFTAKELGFPPFGALTAGFASRLGLCLLNARGRGPACDRGFAGTDPAEKAGLLRGTALR